MESAYWSAIAGMLKHYGPIIALFGLFIAWQTRKIDQLLDRNSSIYEAEIKRLADVQEKLLDKLLGGPQPSSTASPTIGDMIDKAVPPDPKKEN